MKCRLTGHMAHALTPRLVRRLKAAFHDTDNDSPDRPKSLYVRHVRFPREDVGVGVVECGLKRRRAATSKTTTTCTLL